GAWIDLRKLEARLRCDAQPNLRALALHHQAIVNLGVSREVPAMLLEDLRRGPIGNGFVDVVTAEIRVAAVRHEPHGFLRRIDNREIERATAEVIDGDA